MATAVVLIASQISVVRAARLTPVRIRISREEIGAFGLIAAEGGGAHVAPSHQVNYFGNVVIYGTNPTTLGP